MAFTEIEGTGVLIDVSDVNAGTGNYESFLRLQHHGDEEGFNTDDEKEADNKDGIWTHSIKFTDMQVVTVGGVDYYELRLDLNEGNAEGDPPIDLTELRLFYSSAPATGADFDDDFDDLNEVFNLQNTRNLLDVHTGSGSDDYVILVPTSLFPDKTGYFTLYSVFDGADGGFEEWRVLANEIGDDGLPAIHLEKTADPTNFDEGTATNVTFTYLVTSQSSNTDPLSLVSFIDDNATLGDDTDDINLLLNASGTYLGDYYVEGDTNNDGLLQNTETWKFEVTINGLSFNAGGTRTNVAQVFAQDDEGNTVDDSDDAIVTADDVLPAITLVKEADVETIVEGTPTDITYTYTLTSQSADTDPLTVTSLIDDLGDADPLNDVELITGVDALNPLGVNYVSGDANNDQLLQNDETWIFEYTVEDVVLNADEERTNTATVTAKDDEDNPATDDDEETVTGTDALPAIHVEKTGSPTQIQAGTPTLVTFTYEVTNTSDTSLDPLDLTGLVDDMGTAATGDDVDLLTLGTFVGGDTLIANGLIDKGETWTYTYQTSVTLDAGETRTNIVTATGEDDEGNEVNDTDDASITAFNLGRTPGFWANPNNGAKLWDGNDSTNPNGGNLGTNSIADPGHDLAYRIFDLNGDGDTADTVNGISEAVGSRQYLMIGDWDHDGVVDAGENVLVVTRAQALSLLNSSEKQQQDGRYMLARDLVASWLNYIGGSFVGAANDLDSARHYMDEAIAFLRETSANHDHVLNPTVDFSNGTKVPTGGNPPSVWQTGFDFDGDTVKGENVAPASGDILGDDVNLDVMAGALLHSGLDHYNNFGFV